MESLAASVPAFTAGLRRVVQVLADQAAAGGGAGAGGAGGGGAVCCKPGAPWRAPVDVVERHEPALDVHINVASLTAALCSTLQL
eukprot:jgi/Ulvmu1/3710/UM170_0016.1